MDNLSTIDETTLIKHMGKSTNLVLHTLTEISQNNKVDVKRVELADKLKVSLSSVKDAIKRLETSGILLKLEVEDMPRGTTRYEIKSTCVSAGDTVIYTMPQSSYNCILDRPTHGGRRRGAGRPRGAKNRTTQDTQASCTSKDTNEDCTNS